MLTLELEDGSGASTPTPSAVQFRSQGRRVLACTTTAPSTVRPPIPPAAAAPAWPVRYSGTNVKNDLSVNPNFKVYLCRGVDEFKLNPYGPIPTQRYGRPNFKPVSNEEAGKA